MSSDINKGLQTLWKAEPLKFHDFQLVSYSDALQLILHLPKKYSKTAGFLDDNIQKPSKPAKSPVNKSLETSEWADILLLNSGDNDKAQFIYEHINKNYNRTLEKVKSSLLCPNCVQIVILPLILLMTLLQLP